MYSAMVQVYSAGVRLIRAGVRRIWVRARGECRACYQSMVRVMPIRHPVPATVGPSVEA